MILVWLIPALLLAALAMLWLTRKPEFDDVERRDRAMELLREMNPHWVPPSVKTVAHDPAGYTFDDTNGDLPDVTPAG